MSKKKEKQTFNTKLYECCATDDDKRQLFQCVKFENGYAYATDGQIAIKQTLALQGVLNPQELDWKFLHRDNYKAIMSFEIAECSKHGIECWNENGQKAFFEYYEPEEEEVFPDIDKLLNPARGIKPLSFIGISPESLARLYKAIYDPHNNLRMQFTGIDSAILIDVVGVDEQQAMVAPILLNDTLF